MQQKNRGNINDLQLSDERTNGEKGNEDVPLDLTVVKSNVFLYETSMAQANSHTVSAVTSGLDGLCASTYGCFDNDANIKEMLVVNGELTNGKKHL